MREQRNKSFLEELIKWFLIWNIISLLFKGIVFLCKIFVQIIQQVIYLIAIGIRKSYPIVKEKITQMNNIYNIKYKPNIREKLKEIICFFSLAKSSLKEKLSSLISKKERQCKSQVRIKRNKTKKGSIKKKESNSEREESSVILHIKRLKYYIIDFYFKYELQIVTLSIIVLIIVIIVIAIPMLQQ